MKKTAFCICENKGANQLRGNREADQRLCFRYTDSTIPLLPKSEISCLCTSSVAVQPGLCRTWSETPKNEAQIILNGHEATFQKFTVTDCQNRITQCLLNGEFYTM